MCCYRDAQVITQELTLDTGSSAIGQLVVVKPETGGRAFAEGLWTFWDVLKLNYGGEGGIRTPDRLTPMSDFESGAFNRALPPLHIVSYSC
jgi:hypothetical protein